MPEWITTLGVVGFMFFLVKGLAWLAVPALLALWRARKARKAGREMSH